MTDLPRDQELRALAVAQFGQDWLDELDAAAVVSWSQALGSDTILPSICDRCGASVVLSAVETHALWHRHLSLGIHFAGALAALKQTEGVVVTDPVAPGSIVLVPEAWFTLDPDNPDPTKIEPGTFRDQVATAAGHDQFLVVAVDDRKVAVLNPDDVTVYCRALTDWLLARALTPINYIAEQAPPA